MANSQARNFASQALIITLAQMVSLLIPLLTLPLLARNLGVSQFGKLILAQSLFYFVVLFVDSGVNTESQRLATSANKQQKLQILVDNIILRCLLTLPATIILFIINYYFIRLEFNLLIISGFLVIGTLVFPQWWLIALNKSLTMSVSLLSGRIIGALIIVFLVKQNNDLYLAAVASSISNIISFIIILPLLFTLSKSELNNIQFTQWQILFKRVKVSIFSAFSANVAPSLPIVLLGVFSGVVESSCYAVVEKIINAAKHLFLSVEQILLSHLVRKPSDKSKLFRLLIMVISLIFFLCFISSREIILFIYGEQYISSIIILQFLSLALLLNLLRRIMIIGTWTLFGRVNEIAKINWLESILLVSCSFISIYLFANAYNLSIVILLAELLLLIIVAVCAWQQK